MKQQSKFEVTFNVTIVRNNDNNFEGTPQMTLQLDGYFLKSEVDKIAMQMAVTFGEQLAFLVNEQFNRIKNKHEREN